ncbi:MAG: TRAM domain-containing protein [Candidatus Thermoplasmatota archaeon]|jgi:predicted RNA-binding protein with TRAM domain|nr:TRAM domain-containing protein [Candidatus Thermoplasmatota archaeon]MDP7266250.1 TRAM domain-containing protein [Candidatus Thermoplasmatota archaeon]
MGQQRSPPIREGEQYDVRIESLGREGDGIAKVENFVVIVPNTKVGDNIKIRVTKVSRRVAFGEVIKGEAEETEEIEEMQIIDE